MPNVNEALTESYRVLRPGGQLVSHEVVSGQNAEALRYPFLGGNARSLLPA